MGTKKIILAALFSFLLFVRSTCKKNCTTSSYSFELDVKVYPANDTLSIGDTLWFEVNNSTQLKDLQSGQLIDYSNAENLGSAIAFNRLSSSNSFTEKAVNKFNYVLEFGRETKSVDLELLKEFIFSEQSNKYIFLLGIITKEKGTYSIIFSNAGNVFRKNDKCTKAGFAINIENRDRHPYLNPSYTGGVYPPGGDYYFVVK